MFRRVYNSKKVLTWFLLVFLNCFDEMNLPCWLPLFQYSFLPVVMIISPLNIISLVRVCLFLSTHSTVSCGCLAPLLFPWLFSILKRVGHTPPPRPHSFISSASFLQVTCPGPHLDRVLPRLWWFQGSVLALQWVGTREPLRMLGFVPTAPCI